jgi:hypothetical protein
MQTVELKPIVNGEFNFELTYEQMLEFDYEAKKQMAWTLIICINGIHHYRDVAHEVFVEIPMKYTYDMINEETVDTILTAVRKLYEERKKQLLRLTDDFYYQQGRRIRDMQKELGFSGFLKMDFRKLIGYVSKIGNWNDFEAHPVCDAIRKLDRDVPKFYMPNNPNNGLKKHEWLINGDYLVMRFEYLSGDAERKQYLDFYKKQWEPVGRSIKADSIRYELNENDGPDKSFTLELIYWWD